MDVVVARREVAPRRPERGPSLFVLQEFTQCLGKRLDLLAVILDQDAEKCLRFLTETQNADGSWGRVGNPYETALAVRAFASHAPGADEVSRGIDFLLTAQNDGGSWDSDNVIWEFRSDATDIWRSQDVHHVITTSLCVVALGCGA